LIRETDIGNSSSKAGITSGISSATEEDEIDESDAVKGPDLTRDEAMTHFEKITKFLLDNGNRPQTTPTIRRATGIARGALSVVLYLTHPQYFQKLSGQVQG